MTTKQGNNSDDGYKVGPGCPPREHQFKPGESGNPAGRKKGSVSVVKRLLIKLKEDSAKGNGQKVDDIVDALFDLATSGHKGANQAIRTILDRVDGPVVQRLAGPEGEPLFLPKAFIGIDPEKMREGVLDVPGANAVEVEYEEHQQGGDDGEEENTGSDAC